MDGVKHIVCAMTRYCYPYDFTHTVISVSLGEMTQCSSLI